MTVLHLHHDRLRLIKGRLVFEKSKRERERLVRARIINAACRRETVIDHEFSRSQNSTIIQTCYN